MDKKRQLTSQEVFEILCTVSGEEAILIGGQSLNVLALSYLRRRPALKAHEPYTSMDIDFLCNDEAAARALADRWDGELHTPDPSDPTSSLAVVHLALNGQSVEVDFLNHVLGFASPHALRRRAITLTVPLSENVALDIRLLHPVDCLASRILNLEEPLLRSDEQSLRQARAAIEVVVAFIDDKLEGGDRREAYRSLSLVRRFTLSHGISGCHFRTHGIDLIEVLRIFLEDPRLDERFRRHQISAWIEQIEEKRLSWAERQPKP